MDGSSGILQAKEDLYGGVVIDPKSLPVDPAEFGNVLESSLRVWGEQKKRGVWLKLPIQLAALVPVAVNRCGFTYHHAEQDYLMLTTWLCTSSHSTIPPNASHQVGVGAWVFDTQHQEVLVVQECAGPLKGRNVWKIPTGIVHSGENLSEAVEREVFEETGVRARFDSVLAVRQAHGFAFGKSDLFFMCALVPDRAADGARQVPVPQEAEVEAVQWMPVQDYCSQEFIDKLPLQRQLKDRCLAYSGGAYRGLTAQMLESGIASKRVDLLLSEGGLPAELHLAADKDEGEAGPQLPGKSTL